MWARYSLLRTELTIVQLPGLRPHLLKVPPTSHRRCTEDQTCSTWVLMGTNHTQSSYTYLSFQKVEYGSQSWEQPGVWQMEGDGVYRVVCSSGNQPPLPRGLESHPIAHCNLNKCTSTSLGSQWRDYRELGWEFLSFMGRGVSSLSLCCWVPLGHG